MGRKHAAPDARGGRIVGLRYYFVTLSNGAVVRVMACDPHNAAWVAVQQAKQDGFAKAVPTKIERA